MKISKVYAFKIYAEFMILLEIYKSIHLMLFKA